MFELVPSAAGRSSASYAASASARESRISSSISAAEAPGRRGGRWTGAGGGGTFGVGVRLAVGAAVGARRTSRRLHVNGSVNWEELSSSPGRTTLLPLQPATQAMEVEDVSTSKPLRRLIRPVCRCWSTILTVRYHLFSANDTRMIPERCHVLRSRVRVERIHIARGTSISDEVRASREEGAKGHVNVPKDVEW